MTELCKLAVSSKFLRGEWESRKLKDVLGHRGITRAQHRRQFLDQVRPIARCLQLLNNVDHDIIVDSLYVDARRLRAWRRWRCMRLRVFRLMCWRLWRRLRLCAFSAQWPVCKGD